MKRDGQRGMISHFLSLSCVLWVLMLFAACPIDAKQMVITARKVAEELPVEPDAPIWAKARAVEIPMASQVMVRPRIYSSSVKEIRVKALHNSRDIAFLLEWKDNTKDASIEMVHTFSDGAALQFPSDPERKKPHFAMGDEDGVVNIWNWKAVFEEGAEKKTVYAMVDDYLSGREAGNIMSIALKTPVQNLIASGFGSLTAMEEKAQHVSGKGKWEAGNWKVIFRRSMKAAEKSEAHFKEGGLTPVAVAVWDGSNGERGARKAVSTWYYAALEMEAPGTVYLYPIVAFLGAGVLVIGLVIYLRGRFD